MDAVTCQPLAGAHGELTGVLLIAAYHGKGNTHKYVLVPDSSHGTNPASAAMVGFEVSPYRPSPTASWTWKPSRPHWTTRWRGS